MREKQIEELAQVIAHSCIDLVESSCGEGECCVSCLATKLHKEGVTIQKWIPVTERLPLTSADRIRAMSDELLAAQLAEVFCKGFNASTSVVVPDELVKEIMEQFLEQLRQPAEGE